jgi:hypothetical protein
MTFSIQRISKPSLESEKNEERRIARAQSHLLSNTIANDITPLDGGVGTINDRNLTISLQIDQRVFKS